MQITKPGVTMIAKDTWCINEYAMDAMFLLEGKEKALLIDTGTGTFPVKELVESITAKPLIVVCTHGHVDHVGGIGFFDTVYMHPDDFEKARTLTVKTRQDYVAMMNMAYGGLYAVTEADVVAFEKVPEMKPLHEGDVIDLGDRSVVVYETPGHTSGGLSFLDVRERIIFTGDACNLNTLLDPDAADPKSNIQALLETAKKLRELEVFYDRNYNGHIGVIPAFSCLPMVASVNHDAVEICEGLLNGTIQGEVQEAPFVGKSYFASKGAFGVRYSEKHLH